MLLPTSVDLLRCIERTLETVVAPSLTGTQERSATATIGHLLRHVVLRIEHEGHMLCKEIATVRPVLAQVRAYLENEFSGNTEARRISGCITALLARPTTTDGYRDVASLAEEVGALRQSVCDALSFVQAQPPTGTAATLHQALQHYVAWEIEQEAQIIDPAFEGFGPRR
jgi:hypothetical protein